MRIPRVRAALRESATLFMVAALVHGALLGAAAAVHLAEHFHDHDELDPDRTAAIEMIVHGHDHEPGTPDHRHPLVTTNPSPQHLKRFDLAHPPAGVSHAVHSSTPTILRSLSSLRFQPELCGPSPPSLSQSLVVLRI